MYKELALAASLLTLTQVDCGGKYNSLSTAPTPPPSPTAEQASNSLLGVTINEAEWTRVVRTGPSWAELMESPVKLNCVDSNICVTNYSKNFRIAANTPMLEFMLRQTQAINPVKPINVSFIEDWITDENGVYLLSGTRMLDSEIQVNVSLNALALNVFRIIQEQPSSAPLSDKFEGSMGQLTSRITGGELVLAGPGLKRFGLLTRSASTHEQLENERFAFEDRYDELSRRVTFQEQDRGAALIFAVKTKLGFDLQAYYDRISRDALQRAVDLI